ncbi:hypothetical protein [Arthrobacter sp. IK3]|uniref:hypothetical protein n=1 Tax=Arthrobacter sp. IK3 TaxID=3448169 RepID=UPI003EE29F72
MHRKSTLTLALAFAAAISACSGGSTAEAEPEAAVEMPCMDSEPVKDCTDRLTDIVLASMDDYDALASPTPVQSEAYTSLTEASSEWSGDCRQIVGTVASLPSPCKDTMEDIASAALTINPAFLD